VAGWSLSACRNRLRGRRPGWGGVQTWGETRGEPVPGGDFGGGTPGAHGRQASHGRGSMDDPFARAALAHGTGDRALEDDRGWRGDKLGRGLTLGRLLDRTVDPMLRGARGEPPDPEQDREEPDAEVGAARHHRGRSEYEELVEGGRRTPPRNSPIRERYPPPSRRAIWAHGPPRQLPATRPPGRIGRRVRKGVSRWDDRAPQGRGVLRPRRASWSVHRACFLDR
jgi:hypothetical protein